MPAKLHSIQKYGLGIIILSILWLIATRNQNNMTLADMVTINGKITDIQVERVGKYANDTALYCTLDDGHKFYANNFLQKMNQQQFANALQNASKVTLWVEKEAKLDKSIELYQLIADDVVYMDFKKNGSARPNYFWVVISGFILGLVFILGPAIQNISLRRKV
jgi:hypothetical protein